MKLVLISTVLCALANPVQAFQKGCWEFSNMYGVAAVSGDEYKFSKDKITKSKITLIFNGDNSLVTSHDQPLMQVSDYMLIGLSSDDKGVFAAFIYSVDPKQKKGIFMRARDYSLAVLGAAGAVTLVGDAEPCKK